MIRHEVAQAVEPEARQAGEHLAFVRDAVRHDDIEGRDAIGRDEKEQIVREAIGVAHFAAPEEREAGQVGGEQRLHVDHSSPIPRREKAVSICAR